MRVISGRGVAAILLLTALFLCWVAASPPAIAEDRGRQTVSLPTLEMGEVRFNHWRHQEIIRKCKTCHKRYPKETGAIQRLKTSGKLKQKKVMKYCKKCHKKKKTGPLENCEGCHNLKA